MKIKSPATFALACFLAFTVSADDRPPAGKSLEPLDKTKLSYAIGMHAAIESARGGAELDADAFTRAIKDVLTGNPTELTEPEMAGLMNQSRNDGGLLIESVKDKSKVSYALGMREGFMLKREGAEIEYPAVSQAIKDVFGRKPTRLQESDIEPLFERAKTYFFQAQADKNKAAGDPFLARNAKEPGITVLPDGLQYRVIKAGTGEIPSTNEMILVKYRGTFIDGREFGRHDRFLTRSSGGIKGWQDALQRMKLGSKWQIFVPSELAFGHSGEPHLHVGPDTTVIYELELLSVAKPEELQVSSGVGHGLDVGANHPPK